MRKATQKSSPVSLGSKRSCPKCSTKFYDFGKEDLTCPKCDAKFKAQDLALNFKTEVLRKPKRQIPEEVLMDSEDVVVGEGAPAMESVEEIDDDNEGVEDIDVEDSKDDDY